MYIFFLLSFRWQERTLGRLRDNKLFSKFNAPLNKAVGILIVNTSNIYPYNEEQQEFELGYLQEARLKLTLRLEEPSGICSLAQQQYKNYKFSLLKILLFLPIFVESIHTTQFRAKKEKKYEYLTNFFLQYLTNSIFFLPFFFWLKF